jgi:hypothetical protein
MKLDWALLQHITNSFTIYGTFSVAFFIAGFLVASDK